MPKKLTLNDMLLLAASKGGRCLSTEYINSMTPIQWECHKGHQWWARPAYVKYSTWCPRCFGHGRYTAEWLQGILNERGGKCLNPQKTYQVEGRLMLECGKGHTWETSVHSVKAGHWCPFCGRDIVSAKLGLGLEEMQQIAKTRGGKCLSSSYSKRSGEKLEWECADGHVWKMAPREVKHQQQWCPTCSIGVSERLCRAILEKMFGTKFDKKRPAWLRSPNNTQMELDGYNEELGIAFEYNGIQHYAEVKRDTANELESRKNYDRQKLLLCAKRGVLLVTIPYTTGHSQIQEFLQKYFTTMGVQVPHPEPISLLNLDYYPKRKLHEMQEYAARLRGECLADGYVLVTDRVRWRCAEGHEWSTSYNNIKNMGTWCPVCAKHPTLTLQDMNVVAERRGGKCISTEYKNLSEKYLWACAVGHTWLASGNDVRNNSSWCPHCAGTTKLTLAAAEEYAKAKGGECLSNAYINSSTNLRWRCSKGHTWESALGTMRHQGSWCRACAGKLKHTLELMQSTAVERGGRCISKKYVNLNTKLEWECAHGHRWFAVPENVYRHKSWCPVCYKNGHNRTKPT